MIVTLRGESLNWIVRQHPTLFYSQEWYRTEAFAQVAVFGLFGEDEQPWPAAAYAQAFVQSDIPLWPDKYVWTRDTDSEGHKVYCGRSAQYGGLQIHRLLVPEIS